MRLSSPQITLIITSIFIGEENEAKILCNLPNVNLESVKFCLP